MTVAERIHATVKGHVAWTLVGPDAARITRKNSNQYGRTYTFDDGSRLMVPHGTALTEVRPRKP